MHSPSSDSERNSPLGRRISALMVKGKEQKVPGLRIRESDKHCFSLTTEDGQPVCYACGAVIGVLARLGYEQTKREITNKGLEGTTLKSAFLARLLGVSPDHLLFVTRLHASFHDHKRKVEDICSFFLGEDPSANQPPSS